jgi:hypothetical protein
VALKVLDFLTDEEKDEGRAFDSGRKKCLPNLERMGRE